MARNNETTAEQAAPLRKDPARNPHLPFEILSEDAWNGIQKDIHLIDPRQLGAAKYTVYAVEPGMQVAGIGSQNSGGSVIAPGRTIEIADPDWEPRACLYPENAAGWAAFARKREDVARQVRAMLDSGVNPATGVSWAAEGKEGPTGEAREKMVKVIVAKAGPNPRRDLSTNTRRKQPKAPNMGIGAAPVLPEPAPRPVARASDQ